jgi:hypothetical protein
MNWLLNAQNVYYKQSGIVHTTSLEIYTRLYGFLEKVIICLFSV